MKGLLRILDRFQRLFWRPREQKLLLLEAYLLLFLSRVAVLTLPFKHIAAWCGEQGLETDDQEPFGEQLLQIRWAILTASRYGFWNCKCLTQALTAKAMLRRRGLESTLYLGTNKPRDSKFSAHAWLRYGDQILLGGESHEEFVVVAMFT